MRPSDDFQNSSKQKATYIYGMLCHLFLLLKFVSSKSVAVNQTTLSLDGYYGTDFKLVTIPALFQSFSILGLQGKTNLALKMTVMIDGLRNIEVSQLTNIAFNDHSGSMLASQTGRLYWANFRNRNNFSDLAINVDTAATPFVAGRWSGFSAATGAPANESFIVIDSFVENQVANFSVFKSDAASCSKITSKQCANGGSDKIYCLEVQSATKLVFLTYYSMPKCTKLKSSGSIATNFTDTDLSSLNVQGQLLSLCKSSGTGLSASCKIFDLNSSLFVLDNPDLSTPLRTIDYSLNLVAPVVAFHYVLDWGCAFWTAGDPTGGYNVYHKCASDLPADGLVAPNMASIPEVGFNRADRTVWFISDTTTQKYFRMAIGETSSAVTLPFCDVYNLEIGLCSKCAANTLILPSGGCSEPVKVAVPSSQFEAKVNSLMLELKIDLDLSNYEDFITRNTQNDSFLSFSNSDVKKSYYLKVYQSSRELRLFKILRVELIPKIVQSLDSISTGLTLLFPNYTQFQPAASRLLQQSATQLSGSQPSIDLVIPPWVSLSPGQNASYNTFFNHVYMVAFFLKIYFVFVRPWFFKPNTDHRPQWCLHFVLITQTACLLGFNAWDLKGHFGGVMQRAGQASFTFLSWNPVIDLSAGKENSFTGYYMEKFTRAGMVPIFVEELLGFTLIYFASLVLGIVSPVLTNQIRSLRQTTMLCYLPQVWFMFWVGLFNTFVAKAASITNYTSFAFSLILLILSVIEVVLWIVPASYPTLETSLGFLGQARAVAFDSEGTPEPQKEFYPLPIWAHAEIFISIYTGLILGTTQRKGTLQVILLFFGYLLAIPALLLHFRWATNRRIIRFRVAWQVLLTLMLLFSWILHSKETGLEGVTVLTVLAMICYFSAFGAAFGSLVLRFLEVQFGWGGSLQGAPLIPEPVLLNNERNGDNSELSNSAKVAASILDRFVAQEQSRMVNDSRNESVMQIRALDNSVANPGERETVQNRVGAVLVEGDN